MIRTQDLPYDCDTFPALGVGATRHNSHGPPAKNGKKMLTLDGCTLPKTQTVQSTWMVQSMASVAGGSLTFWVSIPQMRLLDLWEDSMETPSAGVPYC